eukprot:1148574-Pelagomonas_calceolata.AAC.1
MAGAVLGQASLQRVYGWCCAGAGKPAKGLWLVLCWGRQACRDTQESVGKEIQADSVRTKQNDALMRTAAERCPGHS